MIWWRLLSLLLLVRPNVAYLTPDAVTLGGQIVAAEARGEGFGEQIAVGAVIGNRVRDGRSYWRDKTIKNPWRSVMLASRQFAQPYERARPRHEAAFLLGAFAPTGWRRRAVAFATPRAVKRLDLTRWSVEFAEIGDTHTAHVYFATR